MARKIVKPRVTAQQTVNAVAGGVTLALTLLFVKWALRKSGNNHLANDL